MTDAPSVSARTLSICNAWGDKKFRDQEAGCFNGYDLSLVVTIRYGLIHENWALGAGVTQESVESRQDDSRME
jgi:hypothetical protein